ncbi:Chemosensory protein CSP1 [Operophtera brumata]|uniref:Chemosensory protein CSP1 n=1 Tax=Operophtera brumata TaxID=104452 RepID=A0A0L7KXY9_OPEBR|nr:Chemosensory protein CSP1 [Operophtera brumata]
MITKSKCDESYTNKYDGVDLAEILASERLLNGYVSCLLGAGPCTPDGNELKSEYSSDGSYKREYLTRLHPEQEKSTNKSKEYEENLKDKLIE